MKTICVIPARYASSRLPGKPLALIGNKPMIQWVYERASAAKSIDNVLIATDNNEIKKTVEGFGGIAVLTDPELPSGTDRVAEAVKNENADVVINLQGDEPFIAPDLLDEMTAVFENSEIYMATPIRAVKTTEELTDESMVRVVRDVKGFALYFSRAVIPFCRDEKDMVNWLQRYKYFRHIGIYAYRKQFLQKITELSPGRLENTEKLEQLRILENGYKIFTVETDYESISVDTPRDLEKVNKFLKNNLIKYD